MASLHSQTRRPSLEIEDSLSFIKSFWLSNKQCLPKLFQLASCVLCIPTNSASVERSISKYNNILSNNRMNLTEDNIKYLNFIYFNLNGDKSDLYIQEEFFNENSDSTSSGSSYISNTSSIDENESDSISSSDE